MDYSLYFERVPEGEKPENEFQYPGPNDLPAWQYWFGEMLYRNTFVLHNMLVDQSDYKVKFINDFLSYHFKKHDDNVDQFIIYIRSIQDYIEMECLKKAPFDLNAWKPLYKLYNPVINKWIERIEKKPQKGELDLKNAKKTDFLRRPIAFCVCLHYEAGEYDISSMTKEKLKKYITDNFKDNTGTPIASAQKVVNTLLGYDLSKEKEKSLLSYSDKTKSWRFRDDNYKYMIETFPDDYNKALKMFERFK